MKKIISILLVLTLICSMSVTTVFADTVSYTNGTTVEYTNQNAEEAYTVTVPAELAPGGNGTVTAQGTWPSNKTLEVTSDETVELVNNINGSDTKVLNITFDGIELAGSDTAEVSTTADVSVASISNALFGDWTGKFNYSVELVEKQVLVGSATFSDGATLSWDELKLSENGNKYSYNASAITDTEVGNDAFDYNSRLTSITIPTGVTSIGKYAFRSCNGLTDVTIPDSVKYIGDNAFQYSSQIISIELPEGLTTISTLAFEGCIGMTSITIPKSVISIGSEAFAYCTSLDTINYTGTTEQWNEIAFGDNWNDNADGIEVICTNGNISLT